MNYKRFSGFTVDDGERGRKVVRLEEEECYFLLPWLVACNDDDLYIHLKYHPSATTKLFF